jgi:TPR repeat protein
MNIENLRKKAEQGIARAQFRLGFMHDKGNGVKQDHKEAVEWYTKAAEQMHAGARNNLGTMYARGEGVEQDLDKAIDLCTKAAKQGYATAQKNLTNINNIFSLDKNKEDLKSFEKYLQSL